jgi:hypothetical protein
MLWVVIYLCVPTHLSADHLSPPTAEPATIALPGSTTIATGFDHHCPFNLFIAFCDNGPSHQHKHSHQHQHSHPLALFPGEQLHWVSEPALVFTFPSQRYHACNNLLYQWLHFSMASERRGALVYSTSVLCLVLCASYLHLLNRVHNCGCMHLFLLGPMCHSFTKCLQI